MPRLTDETPPPRGTHGAEEIVLDRYLGLLKFLGLC